LCAALASGCVSTETHKKSLAELEEARKGAAQTAAEFESFKQQAAAEAASLKSQLADVNARVAALEKEKEQLTAALTESRDRARDLATRLEAEQAQTAKLRGDKQRLLSGTTTAQEEIAQLQKRAGELEAERARANDLAKQLEERLKAEQSEKARLEQERAAKEAEVQRLTRTHEELTRSLEAEIAKGDIKIKQVRDRLTINMVDRVLFDSGQSQVKPAGLKVLKQVSDILKNVPDKQIRIEGHTDNVPIGARLKERFPTNWELSTARATSVVRYLIEEGGVDRANLSAVGYADTKPVAGNETEEGRTTNRRIEIALYPKDLSEIAGQLKP
jgi:chemotaxis protein MotB